MQIDTETRDFYLLCNRDLCEEYEMSCLCIKQEYILEQQ